MATPATDSPVQTALVPPTPLDPPVVYYNTKYRVPPSIARTEEEAAALDPAEWTTNPPPKAAQPAYPKLFANINLEPRIVGDAAEEKALGESWREFSLPEDLVKAAQAKLDAAQKQK